MRIVSVNTGKPKEVEYRGRKVLTGIFKQAVEGRVRLGRLNLDGDGQADLRVHGGAYRAAYAYDTSSYDHWKRELGREDLPPGQFGENFTVEGMPDDAVFVGNVYRFGGAVVEVTQPRTPCVKLGIRMEMETFPGAFLQAGRPGFYLRVVEEGEVGAGDPVELIREDPERMPVREMNHLLHFDKGNIEGIRRAHRIAALSPEWRESFEDLLDEETGQELWP